MGKTPIPLVIWVDDCWDQHPQVAKWREQGHDVVPMRDVLAERPELNPPDIILSKQAWRWDDNQWKYADVPLKVIRAQKKETK